MLRYVLIPPAPVWPGGVGSLDMATLSGPAYVTTIVWGRVLRSAPPGVLRVQWGSRTEYTAATLHNVEWALAAATRPPRHRGARAVVRLYMSPFVYVEVEVHPKLTWTAARRIYQNEVQGVSEELILQSDVLRAERL